MPAIPIIVAYLTDLIKSPILHNSFIEMPERNIVMTVTKAKRESLIELWVDSAVVCSTICIHLSIKPARMSILLHILFCPCIVCENTVTHRYLCLTSHSVISYSFYFPNSVGSICSLILQNGR